MRGVYPSRGAQRPRRAGSSPHARGLRVGRADRSVDWGIIPACAGFTAGTEAFSGQVPDHPRMRGVYPPPCPRSPPRPGSSPHARGLHEDTNLERSLVRIIPACAGFTNLFRLTSMAPPDHPRMRGVYRICSPDVGLSALDHPRMRGVYAPPAREATSRWGSSPHARGLLGFVHTGHERSLDHPRMRGVYAPVPALTPVVLGSSPHARGLRTPADAPAGSPGIIPACAGFTSTPRCHRPRRGDHPRMRGVYRLPGTARRHRRGSSPHARGLPCVSCVSLVLCGIIPACAGFTSGRGRHGAARPDHPRMRGVYAVHGHLPQLEAGSSPHARGLLPPMSGRPDNEGIIPACAGFTRPGGPGPAGYRIIPACAGFTSTRPQDSSTPEDHPRMRGVYFS